MWKLLDLFQIICTTYVVVTASQSLSEIGAIKSSFQRLKKRGDSVYDLGNQVKAAVMLMSATCF